MNILNSRSCVMSTVLLFVLFCSSVTLAQKQDPSEFEPGASFVIPMPSQGKSWDSGGSEPVRGCFVLPTNYRPDRRHPIWLHLGMGQGDAEEVKAWAKLMNKKNYVFIGVDYAASGYDSAFSIAKYLINQLRQAPNLKLNTQKMVLSGHSTGANAVVSNYNRPMGRMFGAYILIACMGSKQLLKPRLLKGRSLYWANGEKELENHRSGGPIIGVPKLHRTLKEAGIHSTMNSIEGKGHGIGLSAFEQDLRKWVYRYAPPFKQYDRLRRKMEKSNSRTRQKSLAQKIHNTWLHIPWKSEISIRDHVHCSTHVRGRSTPVVFPGHEDWPVKQFLPLWRRGSVCRPAMRIEHDADSFVIWTTVQIDR